MKTDKSHDRIQSELFQYVWNYYPELRRCMWHTPNEFKMDTATLEDVRQYVSPKQYAIILAAAKKRFVIQLSKRKSVGVLKGVTDLVIYRKGALHCFDVKIGKDKLSDEQKSFIEAIIAQGGTFHEINSYEQGKDIIDQICAS